mmetsp:Transcript_3351/g.5079  ORF Transcript_3351/g.5079 Transcript_3351/m.5079 type:complete len:886 (-) Transcript_3351:162-2819(-)|eukprot:CAMPEP_0184647264 /NCGR_PEP_ID=MMETSP0308-20130426/4144_1 /TAXON_ID=38269 /ORGANISM="Gloeochaete witrockiana, Strain SAG 46.84" /LENGTH=885 /DNA_ID=CAMNT_0027078075 /DNA_START=80 /DNA_END=2737 /DNA_ORIENTATION=+
MDVDAPDRGPVQAVLKDETVICVAHVTKKGKKKKISKKKDIYLCLSVKKGKPRLHKIEKTSDGSFKATGRTWKLEDANRIDGGSDDLDGTEFSITFDKERRWAADSNDLKQLFLSSVIKLCTDYLEKVPPLVRLDTLALKGWEDAQLKLAMPSQRGDPAAKPPTPVQSLLSPEEEQDIETWLEHSQLELTDFTKFQEYLGQQLGALEAANLHDMLESDDSIRVVADKLEDSSVVLDKMELWLDNQNKFLDKVRYDIKEIDAKNLRLETHTRNHLLLINEVTKTMENVDLSPEDQDLLARGDFSDAEMIDQIAAAALRLQKSLNSDSEGDASPRLSSVMERRAAMDRLRKSYVDRLHKFLMDMIQKKADACMAATKNKGERKVERLKDHVNIHRVLLKYASLMGSLRTLANEKWSSLRKHYTTLMNKAYRIELQHFFAEVRHSVAKENNDTHILDMSESSVGQSSSSSSMKRSRSYAGADNDDTLSVRSGMSASSSKTTDMGTRCKFDQAFGYSLGIVIPLMSSEERFQATFFALLSEEGNDSPKDGEANGVDRKRKRKRAGPLGEGDVSDEQELRIMLETTYAGVETEFERLVDWGDRMDHLYCLKALEEVEEYLSRYKRTASYLSTLLTDLKNQITWRFNQFLDSEADHIDAVKAVAKRCGVLSPFTKIPIFIERLEGRTSDLRVRPVVDEAYNRLIGRVFDWLERIATADPKYSNLARLENYHRFHTRVPVSRHTQASLGKHVEEARARYEQALSLYVAWVVECQFGPLMEFIKGVDKLLKTIPPDEIQFQMSYSKQALRKVKDSLKTYEKNIDAISKRIVKHLSTEEKLTGVVWGQISDYLFQNWKHFESIVSKCYKGEKIDVSSNDIRTKCSLIMVKLKDK